MDSERFNKTVLRTIGIVTFIITGIWFIASPDYEPLVGMLTALGLIEWSIVSDAKHLALMIINIALVGVLGVVFIKFTDLNETIAKSSSPVITNTSNDIVDNQDVSLELQQDDATIVPTATTTVTDPEPTATSKPSPTPYPLVDVGTIFEDDFEAGISSAWVLSTDQLGMSNGNLTVIERSSGPAGHIAYLSDYYWENVRINISLDSLSSSFVCSYPCDEQPYVGVIIRYQPGEDSIGFLIQPTWDGVGFGKFNRDGTWTILSEGELTNGMHRGGADIQIEVQDNFYVATAGGIELTRTSINGPESGMIGLWFWEGASWVDQGIIKDIIITSLP